jgi:creatinine amidohydrolase
MLELSDMTAPQVDDLDRERTCVVLSISPIEEHGPHLPLATDVIEAEGMLDHLCQRLERDLGEWTFLHHPPLPLGVDAFPYPGSISVRPSALEAIVEDIGLSLAREGFRYILISSHHGSPRHNLAIDSGARAIERDSEGHTRALALAGRVMVDLYFNGGLRTFYEEHDIPSEYHDTLDLDCHAGAFETSEVMALRPELVRDVYKTLEEVVVPLWKLSPASAREHGAGLGYFGAPALASPRLGRDYIDFVIDRIYDDVRDFLRGRDVDGLPLPWRVVLDALHRIGAGRDSARSILSRLVDR